MITLAPLALVGDNKHQSPLSESGSCIIDPQKEGAASMEPIGGIHIASQQLAAFGCLFFILLLLPG